MAFYLGKRVSLRLPASSPSLHSPLRLLDHLHLQASARRLRLLDADSVLDGRAQVEALGHEQVASSSRLVSREVLSKGSAMAAGE
jgi:hypothetical protein